MSDSGGDFSTTALMSNAAGGNVRLADGWSPKWTCVWAGLGLSAWVVHCEVLNVRLLSAESELSISAQSDRAFFLAGADLELADGQ